MTLKARVRTGILSQARGQAAGVGMAAVLALGLAPDIVRAQDAGTATEVPVLLELYTAQGCASCPPADDMMIDLASREDVIALALHVDYWDYIGWADTFADRAYTERQQRYARRFGHSTIYTPQVVINGTQIVEGFRVMEVMDTITAQQARPAEVRLHLARTEGGLEIRAEPTADAAPQIAMASRRSAISGMATNSVVGTLSMVRRESEAPAETAEAADGALEMAEAAPPPVAAAPAPAAGMGTTGLGPVGSGPYVVQIVRYRPSETVDILDGENAGLSAHYANIVTSWQPIGSWDMLAPLDLTIPLEGADPVVVIVQESGQGEVIAASRVR
ncbi:DUF1223 domain-containing protein [Pararhodobacter sp.]|uniref:DUF1223 domain-containing protein n=1 Tax=Pararhodobacter sp. TaxID=2127056 RepID=UPI002FDFC020